ncbi:MAG TPA: type II toxin-antitoxin system RelE/ParE family toxin [Chthoniobacterales bacterium]
MSVRFDDEARQEYLEAVRFYAGKSSSTAQGFVNAFEAALSSLCAAPTRFREIGGGVRVCRLQRFPYAIVYRAGGDHLTVLAVKHDRRDPDYWRHRLGEEEAEGAREPREKSLRFSRV